MFVIAARKRVDAEKAKLHPDGPHPVGKWRLHFDERTQTPFWHQESSNSSLRELPQDAEVELSDEDEDGLPNNQELQKWIKSDYYGQLEVGKTASSEEIKQSFLKLSRRHHPDKVAAVDLQEATEYFQVISQAYSVLRNKTWRDIYDEMPIDPAARPRMFVTNVRPILPVILAVEDGTTADTTLPPTFDSEASRGPTPDASRSERKPLDRQPSKGPPSTVERSGENENGGLGEVNDIDIDWDDESNVSKEDEGQERKDEVKEDINDATVEEKVQERVEGTESVQVVSEQELLEFAPPPPPLLVFPEEEDDEKIETKVEETKYRFGVSRSLVNARFAEPVETRTHRSFNLWDNYPAEPEVPAPWQRTEEVPAAESAGTQTEATQTERTRRKRRGQPRVRPPPGVRIQLREAAEAAEAAAVEAERRATRSSLPASSKGTGKEGSLWRTSSGAASSWES